MISQASIVHCLAGWRKAGPLLILSLTAVGAWWAFLSSSQDSGLPAGRHEYVPAQQENQAAVVGARNTANATRELGQTSSAPVPPRDKTRTANTDSLAISAMLQREAEAFANARGLIDRGDFTAGLSHLEAILARSPEHLGALTEAAMILRFERRQPAAALPYYERAYELNAASASLLAELVALYDELHQMKDGLAFLQKVAAAEPPTEPILPLTIGKLLVSSGRDFAEAIPYLEEASALAGGSHARLAQPELGHAYAQLGDAPQAQAAFTAALQGELQRYRDGEFDQTPEEGRRRLALAYMDYAAGLYLAEDQASARSVLQEKVLQMHTLPFEDLHKLF